jgi:hypothetical protein
MALAGSGAVCIWNDITPEGRDEFYAWHLHEHMPERAAIPGFRRGRRYVALDAATGPEFFTLYETVNTAVLTGPNYLARLNAPTPWTKTATQAFRNTSRALTSVAASLGPGLGGILATLRFAVAAGREVEAVSFITTDALAAAAARPRIAGAHLCVTDADASASKTAESRDRTDIQTAPGWIMLIEGCDEEAVRGATAALEARIAFLLDGTALAGFYRFEFQCEAQQ